MFAAELGVSQQLLSGNRKKQRSPMDLTLWQSDPKLLLINLWTTPLTWSSTLEKAGDWCLAFRRCFRSLELTIM